MGTANAVVPHKDLEKEAVNWAREMMKNPQQQ